MPNIVKTLKGLYATDKAACLNMLPELFKQHDEGLIKVLPCKVGDKVKVRADTWGYTGNFKTIEDGKFLVGEIIAIVENRKQTLMKIQVEHNVLWKRERNRYPVSALGITVFTRKEAEKALKECEHYE